MLRIRNQIDVWIRIKHGKLRPLKKLYLESKCTVGISAAAKLNVPSSKKLTIQCLPIFLGENIKLSFCVTSEQT